MPVARKTVVDVGHVGVNHCISRCVRRAFLCGLDSYIGASYEHRRGRIADRLKTLSSIFSMEVFAYAVVSNHLHVVVCGESEYDRVVSNAFDEMRMCVDALAEAGCRRIGYIDNRGHQESSEDRWKGAYLSAGRREVLITPPHLEEKSARDAPQALDDYIRGQDLDGLVVGSRMMIRTMMAREKRKGRLPFVCLERNAWPDWVSGVETNFRQIGAEAVQLLINRILSPHASDPAHRTIAVHSTWHEGRSHCAGQA